MVNVGIVGMDVIGTHIADAIEKGGPGVALPRVEAHDPARARVGGIASVTMETRKPSRGPVGAPRIERRRIDLDAITTEMLIFEGPAIEVVRTASANMNVVAAVSLAGVGPEKAGLRIFAVPSRVRSHQRMTVEKEFGRLSVENVSPENAPTGKLSCLAAIAMLRELGAPVQVGN